MKKIFSVVMILLLLMNMSIVFAEEYYVQVGAFESEAKAIKYTKYLNDIGYTAVMIPVYDLYKVFLGPYETEEKARADLKQYKENGSDAFFVIGSQMYYQRPEVDEAVEIQIEKVDLIDETSTETEENITETVDEVVEVETDSGDETDDEVFDEDDLENEVEPVDVNETIVTRVVEQTEVETPRYKIFTIMLIVVLWVLFIAVVVVVRLKQSKNG